MLLALKSIPVAFQSTVPLGHCTAWCPSLPHMLHPVSDPPGRRSRWCFSMGTRTEQAPGGECTTRTMTRGEEENEQKEKAAENETLP